MMHFISIFKIRFWYTPADHYELRILNTNLRQKTDI